MGNWKGNTMNEKQKAEIIRDYEFLQKIPDASRILHGSSNTMTIGLKLAS